MPSLTEEEVLKIIDKHPNSNEDFLSFVETGTHLGQTLNNLHRNFLSLISIEVSELYYNRAKQNVPYSNVSILLGDSAKLLQNTVLNLTYNTVFFLDGHYSSGDTGKGEKDCPLIEEVTSIINSFKHCGIIIIDDYNLFETKRNEDWSEINRQKLLDICSNRLLLDYVKDDRLIINIDKK